MAILGPGPERDARIVEMYLAGVKQADIGREFGISQPRVSSTLARLGAITKFDPTELVTDFVATGQEMRAEMIELAKQEAPPAFDQRGGILTDDRGRVVRDYSGKMAAVVEERNQRREISRLLGLDAPKRVELEATIVRHVIDGVDPDAI